ncbi:hypothetical protein WICMUC_004154 [Wickerhamomyces mucosus]|uniref:Uncharacterized protein n=1 Tax=Wickerhamomyces mucosus TaxID=1378264 RepID=A0A9P8PI49_9ASCO|nr:hypothetical protein WICMUC_004154 [Wickerhamomyces mucosus]
MNQNRCYSTLLKLSHQPNHNNNINHNSSNGSSHHNFKKKPMGNYPSNYNWLKRGVLIALIGYGFSIYLIKNDYKLTHQPPSSSSSNTIINKDIDDEEDINDSTLESRYRDSLYWAGF